MRRARRILALMIAQNGALNFSFNKRERTCCCCCCLLQSITIWWGQYRISHIPASPLNAVCVCVCVQARCRDIIMRVILKYKTGGKTERKIIIWSAKTLLISVCVCCQTKAKLKVAKFILFLVFLLCFFFLVPVLVFVVVSLRVLAASPLCNVRLTRKPTNL